MSRLGFNLIFFGVGSIPLNLFQYEFILLMWIDTWGPTVGWAIRIGLIAVGVVLVVFGRMRDSAATSEAVMADPQQYPPDRPAT